MASQQLQGKVIVITGASAGIGKALATECAKHGASVVLAARRKERLDTITADIQKDGGKALAVETDVSKESDVKRMVNAAVKHFGRIDVLVNNAGFSVYAEVMDLPPKVVRAIFDVNFFGLYYGCRAVVPEMKKRGGGHIINISSIVGLVPIPVNGPYCATKFAVNALSDVLHMELAQHNITVSTILPGPVDTEFGEVASEGGKIKVLIPWWFSFQSPKSVARIIVQCIRRPKRRVFTSGFVRLFWIIYAHAPGLVVRFLSSQRLRKFVFIEG